MTTTDSLPAVADLCEQAEAECRVVARRDLDGVPLYIVPQSHVPEDRGGRSVCDGFTTSCLDLYLRDVIGSRWAGRGPCMVIRDIEATGSMDACDVEVAFRSVVFHELAHILTRNRLWSDAEHSEPTTLAAEAVAIGQQVAGPEPSISILIPFYGHGACFIRSAMHLCYRAKAAGILVSPADVCDSLGYGLSRTNAYVTALGSEPRRLASERFLDILATPYPTAFWRLWTTDVAQWLSRCSPVLERSSK